MGVLPNFDGNWTQEVSLIHNNTGVFENSWLNVRFNTDSPCVWTKGLKDMDIPIRHGEGRFITKDKAVLDRIKALHLDTVIYNDRNPNGSECDIAGITDTAYWDLCPIQRHSLPLRIIQCGNGRRLRRQLALLSLKTELTI